MPYLQKIGFKVDSGLAAGLGHSAISAINRISVYENNSNITTSTPYTNIGPYVNKLIDNYLISPLQELLSNGEMMNYLCLFV
jgi:hypothetical protein